MSDFTFPIPGDQANLDRLESAISDNANAIAQVLQPLGEQMVGTIAANGKDLTSVTGRIKRPVGKVIKANQADLARVIGPLADQADGAVALNRSQLGTVCSVLPDGTTFCKEQPPPAPGDLSQRLPAGVIPPPLPPLPREPVPRSLPPAPTPGLLPPLPPSPSPAPPGYIVPTSGPCAGLIVNGQPVKVPNCPPMPDPGAPWRPVCDVTQCMGVNYVAWFALCRAGVLQRAEQVFITTLASLNVGLPAGYEWRGPFASQQEANCAGGTTPPPPPTPTPAPPPTPTPTPTPQPGPPASSLYYIICGKKSDGTPEWYVVNGHAAIDALGPNDKWDGPWNTYNEAAAQAAQNEKDQVGCERRPPEPKVCVTKCTLPPALRNGIPIPGSNEWCKAQKEIIDLFTQVGKAILDWCLKGLTDTLDKLLEAADAEYGALNPIGAFLTAMKPFIEDFRCFVLQAVDCWRQFTAASSACSAETVLSITVLRALFHYLGHIQWGGNAGVWFVGHFRLDVRPLRLAVDYIFNAICPSKMPSISDAIHLWSNGFIDRDVRDCWLAANGANPATWHKIAIAASKTVGAAELQEYATRLGGDENKRIEALLDHGWIRQYDLEAAATLWHKVPELESWIRWNNAGILDQEIVATYGLLEGFTEGFWPAAQYGVEIKGRSIDSAAREYAASWKLPSAEQAKQFLYRLRPGADGVTTPFSHADYQNMIEAEHWAPAAQRWLDQVVHRVVDMGTAQSLVNWQLLSWDQWKSLAMDNGYSEATTEQLYQYARQVRARDRASSAHGWTLAVVAQSVRQTVVTRDQAHDLLDGQGYSAEEVETAYQREQTAYLGRIADRAAQRARLRVQLATMTAYGAGTVDSATAGATLVSVGYSAAAATAVLAAADMTVAAQIATKATAQLKSAYLKGEITLEQAGSLLASAGISAQRSASFLQEWAIEFAAQRPTLATSQILRLVGEGLLPASVAHERLRNLGWAGPDLLLLEAEVGFKLKQQTAKAAAAAQKRQPESKLRKWFLQRIITAEYAEARLRLYGYDEVTIAFLIESWTEEQRKADQKPARSARTGRAAAGRQTARPAATAEPVITPDAWPEGQPVPLDVVQAWFVASQVTEDSARLLASLAGLDDEQVNQAITAWTEQRAAGPAAAPPAADQPPPTVEGPPPSTRPARPSFGPDNPLPEARQVPLRTLRAWFLDGLMDEEDVYERLISYGYSEANTLVYIDEWRLQRDYRDAKARPPAPL